MEPVDFSNFAGNLPMGSLRKSSKIEKSIGSFLHSGISCDLRKMRSGVRIRSISRFLLIFVGSPSVNFLKIREIDQILTPLRIFREITRYCRVKEGSDRFLDFVDFRKLPIGKFLEDREIDQIQPIRAQGRIRQDTP